MARSWLAWLARVYTAVTGALPYFLLTMQGELELTFHSSTRIGLFVVASMLLAGEFYSQSILYKLFMRILVVVSFNAFFYRTTYQVEIQISSHESEWILFGVMAYFVLPFIIPDICGVVYEFKVEEFMAAQLVCLIWSLAFIFWSDEKAFGDVVVFYIIPAFALGTAIILVDTVGRAWPPSAPNIYKKSSAKTLMHHGFSGPNCC